MAFHRENLEKKIVANMISKYRNLLQLLFHINFVCMAMIYVIWIIRIRLNEKQYPTQIQNFLISGRIGLQNPDPVHHWCRLEDMPRLLSL